MPKTLLADNYIKAFNVLYKELLIVNTIELSHDDRTIILQSEKLTPDKLLIKRQQFNNLSSEAKEVIQLIINTPTEIIDLIRTPRQKRITKVRVKRYLNSTWADKQIIEQTIKELEKWVAEL